MTQSSKEGKSMSQTQEKLFYELTIPQKSILMSEQFFNEPHAFIIPAWACIKDKVDFSILEQAINYVVKNHDAHRTHFIKIGQETMQYFENYVPFNVEKIVVQNIDELEDYLKDITFNIYTHTPLKFIMFENLTGDSGFCCILHHLIGDAWSLSLILEEVLKIYNDLLNYGTPKDMRTSSYINFIYSEEEYLHSDKFQKAKEYWENKFSNSSEILSFKNSNTLFETDSNRTSFNVPQSIVSYCKNNKISMFSFFFAVISLYFSRISNIQDIIIGTPYLNRTNAKEKNSMGMFISTLPFKQQVNPDSTVTDFIKDITINQLGSLRHQKYPYAELQKYYTAKFGRINNLYDVMFSYQNAKADKSNMDFDFYSRWVFTKHQVESLVISISDIDNTSLPVIDYDYITCIFNESDIVKINDRFTHIANQMMQSPDMKLKDIDIVTLEEKDILINKFNNTKANFKELTDSNKLTKKSKLSKDEIKTLYDLGNNMALPVTNAVTIATLFSKIAKENPNNIALVFNNEEMTYKELDEKSNYLADILVKNKVKPNTFVGVLFNRSFEMIISILAILKAGAAYMPINPDYPDDRISYMISDSDCKLLLVSSDLSKRISDIQKLIINKNELQLKSSFNNISKSDDLAYVIYTSGSTGKPKGVMIRHYNIVNTLLWRKKEYKFNSDFNVLQIPCFAFDSSVEDIFTPLISGAKLILINQSNSNFDMPQIKELIKKYNANHMLVVPSFYNVLLNDMPEELKNYKVITVAGEGFSIELVKKHFKLLPNVRLFNEYGPTENSVCTSFYEFSENDDEVIIGKPISNCKCYILNSNLKMQPFNVKGELYVSGLGVAKGYIGRQDLTNERFIENPFEKGSIMYKTGDIVSINEAGLMTFYERVDYQVKHNGFRINLGEIESAISSYIKNPNVVVLLKKIPSGTILSAYIETKKEIDIVDLKQNLKKFLPHYMIPNEINCLPKFPITPNAKIDRKALEKMQFKQKDNIIVAPRNKLDKKILDAWKTILNQENISIDDNIFELGGDSLSIISIQSVLFKNGVKVNSQALFENPTISTSSDYIASKEVKETNNDIKLYSPIKYTLDEINDKVSMPKHILLTGVTGFLGSHILAELLNNYDDIKIYCLVRSKPNKSNIARLFEILHYYFHEKYDLLINDRIIPIEGDLSRENLGIDITLYKSLTSKIDSIINAASLVKHFGDYNLFYNSNVLSVKNIIKFAKEANASINDISTTSVSGNYLVKNDITYDYTENDFYIGQNYKDNVYVRTKFEAENELFKAQSEGVKVNIFRVGNLMQRASDGVFQINKFDNAYFKRIYGFTKLRKLPNNLVTQKLEFTPVDACAEAIVKLLVYENKVFHLLNPNLISITELISALLNYNINISFITPTEFNKFIHNDENVEYLENFITDLNNSNKLNYETNIHINDNLTLEFLKNNNFSWPMITKDYLNLFIKNILEETNEKEQTKNEQIYNIN